MSWLSRWRTRIGALVGRRHRDEDVDRELASWVDELTARYEARGLPAREARRRALIDTEGVEQVKERVRDTHGWLSPARLSGLLRADVATALRAVRVAPLTTVAAVSTLAAAVGLNLAMAGLIGRALLRPPAHVSDPGRVFTMTLHGEGSDARAIRTAASYPTFRALHDDLTAIARVAAFQRGAATVLIDQQQHAATRMVVSDEYFDVLGARSMIGTGIVPNGDRLGSPAVVVSHEFWQRVFGGDPAVIGRHIGIAGLDYAIAGVMPAGFSGHTSTATDLWMPFAAAMRNVPGWDRDQYRSLASIVIRLKPGVTDAMVAAQARASVGQRVSLSRIAGTTVGDTERRVVWWLSGVSVLVLLIGLANAGTLLVVRAIRRRPEAAIRAALGATRGRLVSQAVVDGCIIGLVVAACAACAAWWLDESIRRVLFPSLVANAGLTRRTIGAVLAAAAGAAVVASAANLWPLRSLASPAALSATMRAAGRRRTLTLLLVVQTSLSVVLVAGAAVFGRSLFNLASQDFGMNMEGVAIVEFDRDAPGPPGVFDERLDAVRALPGVEMVAPIASVPFGGRHVPPISVPGRDRPPSVGNQLPFLNAATPEFMAMLDIRVIDGRSFTAADGRGAPVVIVNETMAREVWPGERAVGKCIRIGFDPDFDPDTATGPPMPSKVPCREVIGITRDIRQRSLLPVDNEARLMQYFVPFSQVPYPPFVTDAPSAHGLLVRTSAGIDTLAPLIRRVIVGQRTDLPFVRVVPYRQLLEPQLRPWRMATTLLVLFSALALSIAAVGLYAVFAHAVAERRREMAIRVAVGGGAAGIAGMVLREALMVAAAGVVVGGATAVIAGHAVQALLFETAPSDPFVLGSAAALMLAVAAGATLIPARAASKADPGSLLKTL